jgi:hypothetical protein
MPYELRLRPLAEDCRADDMGGTGGDRRRKVAAHALAQDRQMVLFRHGGHLSEIGCVALALLDLKALLAGCGPETQMEISAET